MNEIMSLEEKIGGRKHGATSINYFKIFLGAFGCINLGFPCSLGGINVMVHLI